MRVLNSRVNMDSFFEKVHRNNSLLMLDYDGTLAPLVKERMQAFPYQGVADRLYAVIMQKTTHLVIVSGRSLSDLELLLSPSISCEIWGSHGLERKLPSGERNSLPMDSKLTTALNQAAEICKKHTSSDRCEIKPYAVALHLRGEDEKKKSHIKREVQKEWENLIANYDLEIHSFDEGIELRPKGKNKGRVVNE